MGEERHKLTGCVRRRRIGCVTPAGTSLANAGLNLSYVRDPLGHGDLSTTSIDVHGGVISVFTESPTKFKGPDVQPM